MFQSIRAQQKKNPIRIFDEELYSEVVKSSIFLFTLFIPSICLFSLSH